MSLTKIEIIESPYDQLGMSKKDCIIKDEPGDLMISRFGKWSVMLSERKDS